MCDEVFLEKLNGNGVQMPDCPFLGDTLVQIT